MKKLLSTGVIVMTAVATFTPIVHTLTAGAAGTNTTVVLTFDDDRSDQMTANSLMDARGMVGTFYINSNTVGTSGHMTWAQIQAIQASGDEIGGHTLDFPHEDLTKVSTTEATRQACTDRTASQSHGLTINDFAYPFGAGWDSQTVRSIVQSCGYSSARRASGLSSTGSSLHADSSPPADIWAVKTAAMPDNTFSLATLQAMVTSAENSGGGIVTIVFHEAIGNMTAFLDWLQPRAANGTITRTMSQAINNTTPPPPPPPPSGPYAPTVVADGPAGYWRLDETSGATAANSVSGGTAGTYANVTLGAASLLPADTDTAASFSGTNSRVQVASSTALSPTAALSVEAWIKPTSLPATGVFRSIATKSGSYALQFNGPRVEFVIVQGSRTRRLQAPSTYVLGTTAHVVGTYDGSALRLYVNGALVASSARTGAFTANSNAFYIGSTNGSSEFFVGTIDEVAVYRSALSAAKVTSHYTNGTNAAPPAQNQLTVSKGGAGTGTVTSSPAGISCGATCAASFNTGSSVTLTAAPAAGSTFGGWSGGGCTGTGTCVVPLTADTSVTASFTPVPTSTLTAAKTGTGTGTVSSSPAGISCGATCAASFNTGSNVTLTAAPAAGSTFDGWSGACTGTSSCVVTLNADASVTASFSPVPTSTLTVSKGGAGAGTVSSSPAGISCGATCAASFNTGSSVTLTAAPAAGSTFGGWSGGGCSGTGSCVVALTADAAVTATFAVAPVSSYQPTVLGDAPAGYWRLDETAGTTAANAVAGGSIGTYRGVTLNQPGLLADAADTSVLFNSTTSRVAIPSTTALSPTARVTLEAWIKPTALPAAGAFASIVTKAEAYSLQFNGPRLEFTIIQGSTRRRLQAPVGAVAVGGVYHVVGTYDGTTQRLYINGTEVANVALTGAINANTTALYIGSWDGTTELFKGTIDEVAVYNTVLTAAQVAAHRNAGVTP